MGSGTMHHELIPINNLRVCIDVVYDDCREYEVSCPTNEETCLVELIGGFLIWPTYLMHPTQNIFLNYIFN
jgi:hypothetical protein